MTKPELVTFIMERTAEHKKTNLLKKHKDELEIIAAALSALVGAVSTEADTQRPTAVSEAVDSSTEGISITTEDDLQVEPSSEPQPGYEKWSEPATAENAPSNLGEPSDIVSDYLPAPVECADEVSAVILDVYEENKKIVKARRMDKNEFVETVVEKTTARVIAEHVTDQEAIKTLTVTVMQDLLTDLVAFCPMNDNEKKMLETIPLLPDYQSVESQVNGKGFLQKVKELHNIEINTSRALMVSLKKKRYITIGGGKKTFIILLERGVRYLSKIS